MKFKVIKHNDLWWYNNHIQKTFEISSVEYFKGGKKILACEVDSLIGIEYLLDTLKDIDGDFYLVTDASVYFPETLSKSYHINIKDTNYKELLRKKKLQKLHSIM